MKRQRLESGPRDIYLEDERLRNLMGGKEYCKEDEIPREVLLEFILGSKAAIVVKTFPVTIQRLDGSSFEVKMDHLFNTTVNELKWDIEKSEGVNFHSQQLFLLNNQGEEAKDDETKDNESKDEGEAGGDVKDVNEDEGEEAEDSGEEEQRQLSEDDKIEKSCTILLCVKIEKVWKWDVKSPLIPSKVYELSARDNSITTKAERRRGWDSCLVTESIMESGIHTISFKLLSGAAIVGVVRDGTPCDKDPFDEDSQVAWGLETTEGSLYGHGKEDDDGVGDVIEGQVITLQLDLSPSAVLVDLTEDQDSKQEEGKQGDQDQDQTLIGLQTTAGTGTLKFWVDGDPYGPGFTGVDVSAGPLRWGVSLSDAGFALQIVSTPELSPWQPWDPSDGVEVEEMGDY